MLRNGIFKADQRPTSTYILGGSQVHSCKCRSLVNLVSRMNTCNAQLHCLLKQVLCTQQDKQFPEAMFALLQEEMM